MMFPMAQKQSTQNESRAGACSLLIVKLERVRMDAKGLCVCIVCMYMVWKCLLPWNFLHFLTASPFWDRLPLWLVPLWTVEVCIYICISKFVYVYIYIMYVCVHACICSESACYFQTCCASSMFDISKTICLFDGSALAQLLNSSEFCGRPWFWYLCMFLRFFCKCLFLNFEYLKAQFVHVLKLQLLPSWNSLHLFCWNL